MIPRLGSRFVLNSKFLIMVSDKLCHIIWIDDKCNEDPFFVLSAKKNGIIVHAFEFVKDGLNELENNFIRYDGIILDVKCLYESKDEAEQSKGFYAARKFLLQLTNKTGREIPCFVYSGQPDYKNNAEFENYLNGEKLYVKGADDKKLLEDIKTVADKRLSTQIRHKYLDDVGKLPDNIVSEMTDILTYVENVITNKPDVFNKMRAVLDWLMVQLNEYGLLAVKHNGANLNACSVYLGKKELSDYVPVHIQRSMHSCVEICNNGSHRIEIFNIVQGDQAPFLIRSTAFELLNLLKWFNLLPRDAQSVAKMKALVATVPPDDKIEGKLERDQYNNYHCGNCLIYESKVLELNLQIDELIRVTSYGENTKGHPAVIAKYPRFAHKVERQ